jgi:hypothetical protein
MERHLVTRVADGDAGHALDTLIVIDGHEAAVGAGVGVEDAHRVQCGDPREAREAESYGADSARSRRRCAGDRVSELPAPIS